MRNILGVLILVFGTISLIFSYQSGTNASADNGYARVDAIQGEIYYNDDSRQIQLSNDRLYTYQAEVLTYSVGERELVSIFVSDLEIEDPVFEVTNEEKEILYRITEAEATGGDIESKKNICSAVLNRVDSDSFPNSIKDVVFQKHQFSPTTDGRYNKVKPTDETIEAVNDVLNNGVSHNCLYFFAMRDVKSPKIKSWIKSNLVFEFKDDIGHSYYSEK